jgi:glycine betaine catabolism B
VQIYPLISSFPHPSSLHPLIPHPSSPLPMLKLKITNSQSGKFREAVLTLDKAHQECLIGRTTNCDLVLDGLDISRSHAKIKYQNKSYYFIDLNSANGSEINQSVAQANQDYLLKLNDVIQMGDFLVQVEAIEIDGGHTIAKKQLAITDKWIKGDLTVRCVRITHETPDVKTFTFMAEPPVRFQYQPGQFVNLELNIQGETVSRSYSISSTPSRPHTLEITVKRVPAPIDIPQASPGLVSNWLHDYLQVGHLVQLNGPLGKFTCAPAPPAKLLLISAGSGITPMMSMARWLADTAATCDVVFFHSARTPNDIIFRQELEYMSARLPNFRFVVSTTRSAGAPWLGLTGRFTDLLLTQIAPDFLERTVYVCGPNGFMQHVKALLLALGLPMTQYYEESFGAAKPAKPAALPVKLAQPARPAIAAIPVEAEREAIVPQPQVHFAQSGQEVLGDGAASILELAEQAGVRIRSNCRQGVCGACKKRKLEGKVQYETEPDALEPDEQAAGYVLTCVAAPVGRVVIEA